MTYDEIAQIYYKNNFSQFISDYKYLGLYSTSSLTIKDVKKDIFEKMKKYKNINFCLNDLSDLKIVNDKYEYYQDNKKLIELQFKSKIYLNYVIIYDL